MERVASALPSHFPTPTGVCATPEYPEPNVSMNIGAEYSSINGDKHDPLNPAGAPNQNFQESGNRPSPLESAITCMVEITQSAIPDMELPAQLQSMSDSYRSRFKDVGNPAHIEKAFAFAIRALSLTPEGHPDLPRRLESLGNAYAGRVQVFPNMNDIEQAIEHFSRAISLLPNDSPDLPRVLGILGAMHIDRFRIRGDMASKDLENAISIQYRAFALTPEGHPELPRLLEYLGTSHGIRFQIFGNPKDLENAINFHSRAVPLWPEEHPEFRRLLGSLGINYMQRFLVAGNLKDINSAIAFQARELSLTPAGHPEFLGSLERLGVAYGTRFQRLGDPKDVETAIQLHSRILALTPKDHPGQLEVLQSLAASYGARFSRLGDRKDMENAIDLLSRVLLLIPEGHPQVRRVNETMGRFYMDFSVRLGELHEVEKAVEHLSRAVGLTPTGHPNLPTLLGSLGASYRLRFQWLGELSDARQSIEYLTRSVSLTPEGHPDLPARLDGLGILYALLFNRQGELECMEKSIEFQSRAVSLTPEGYPMLPMMLGALGDLHKARFLRLNRLEDLENAINCHSRALSLAPKFDPMLPQILESLGSSHFQRFRRLAELDDIDKAVEYHFRAHSLTPGDHTAQSTRLAALGTSHMIRFQRLAEPDDIEKGIKYLSRALSLTPKDRADVPGRLKQLGEAHVDRFEYLQDPADLDKAIDLISRALSCIPDGHTGFPELLHTLGETYRHRFVHFKQFDDLQKAVEYHAKSISLTPNDHSELPDRLLSLGSSYRERFRHLHGLPDLEQAIELHSRALLLTPQDHPGLIDRLSDLAMSLMDHYVYSGDSSHLQRALTHCRKAAQSKIGAPRSKLTAALNWARYASAHRQPDCIEAYQTAIDLLPQVIWMGATTNQRYQNLRLLSDLAVEAASVAFSGANYAVALGWLENARCVVWNQTVLLRSPLDELQSAHPAIAERLQKSTTELQRISLEPRLIASDPFSSDALNLEAIARHHRRLATEYDQLLSEVRQLPRFEDFLRPKKASELVHAARNGAIVMISCHKSQCNAMAILPGRTDIIPIPLSNFTNDKAQTAHHQLERVLIDKGLRERGVKIRPEPGQAESFRSALKLLWYDVVKPVLEAVGYLNSGSGENLPHITWCPTGAVSFLPLHAAGDYDLPQSRVFNHVISSYTPTLTALLSPPAPSLNPDSHLLGIGQEATPGWSPLPGTKKELGCIKAHTQNTTHYSELTNDKATRSAVLDAMEKHDWVHLACHANQNVDDPTKSGFHLHDGTLDLSAITQRSFKNKGLAFLSACQTATGDEKLPDEAVHLASGMLMAGYPSVIATMWSVVDDDAPFVADKVYSRLMKVGTIGKGEVGRALHDAVAGLRERVGEKEFTRWVPYIHIGS